MSRPAAVALALVGCLAGLGWAGWAGRATARTFGAAVADASAPPLGVQDRPYQRPAPRLDQWLYNPRERADAGLEALTEGRLDDALQAFDTAADLAEEKAIEEPWALYDAGSARLLADRQATEAISLLERAAESAPPELAPRALYNLGNARLAAGDPAGATDAYRQALRLAPDLREAKRNLEIAWERLKDASARDEQPPSPPREEAQDDEQQPRAGAEQRGEEQPPEEAGDRSAPDQSAAQQPGEEDEETSGSRPEPAMPPPALPRFEEQPDMTAEQAAALLEAIDHLERSQRRLEAAHQARINSRRTKEKDW